jgi:hypothetical protein
VLLFVALGTRHQRRLIHFGGRSCLLHTRSQQTWPMSGGQEHGRLWVGLAAACASWLRTSLPTRRDPSQHINTS